MDWCAGRRGARLPINHSDRLGGSRGPVSVSRLELVPAAQNQTPGTRFAAGKRVASTGNERPHGGGRVPAPRPKAGRRRSVNLSVNILRQQGYEVVEAGDGEEAIALLGGLPKFDLLFTDVALPGSKNGVDIADEAVRLTPGIKVLYTTGYAEQHVIHDGRLNQGMKVINKPYRRSDLLGEVRLILDSERA